MFRFFDIKNEHLFILLLLSTHVCVYFYFVVAMTIFLPRMLPPRPLRKHLSRTAFAQTDLHIYPHYSTLPTSFYTAEIAEIEL